MIFDNITSIVIPEGTVQSISVGNTILWEAIKKNEMDSEQHREY